MINEQCKIIHNTYGDNRYVKSAMTTQIFNITN